MSGFEPLVGFNNNFDDNDLYYFDLSNDTWVKCKPIGRLPYNLCKYQIENSEQTFVTCTDSYRLIDNLEKALSKDEMHKEKEWRDSIVKAQEEVDFFHKDKWHQMIVAWVKADIIPGVLHIKQRRNDYDLCGYFYKESKKLAKKQTKTSVITEKQLQEENEHDEIIRKHKQKRRDSIKEVEKTLKLYKIKDEFHNCYDPIIKKMFFYDTLPYYQSLKLNNDNKLIPKEDWDPKAPVTYEEYLAKSNHDKCLTKLVREMRPRGTSDMVSIEDEYTDIKNCRAPLKTNYDAFYNIKIYNATYARLKCDYKEVDCDVIDYSIDNKKIFGFFDITEKNPLFNSTIAETMYFETDGDKITFEGILMDYLPRYILKCSQLFTVNHFPTKGFVIKCNTFCGPTMPYPYERIEETPHNSSYELRMPL